MKISIKQFVGNNMWSSDYQLHFIINNLDTKLATYHEGNSSHTHGLLYEEEDCDHLIEPFKFRGELK